MLALPKGGGAVRGLGEQFKPDLQTGVAHFSIPIELPSGRNGVQPSVALRYSSASGNGLLGLGWSLGLSEISRRTARESPSYGPSDVFVLSGGDDLAVIDDTTPGLTLFRPRTERSFSRIERHVAPNTDYWVVRTKDGLTHTYGTAVPVVGEDPRAVCRPQTGTPVTPQRFQWWIAKTVDPVGNWIEYEYQRDAVRSGWDQLYPKSIRYANFTDGAKERHLVSVDFEYESRSDAFSSNRAGFPVRTAQRLKALVVRSHVDASKPLVIRRYLFGYAQAVGNDASLLTWVGLEGERGTTKESMPPILLGYSALDLSTHQSTTLRGSLPNEAFGSGKLETADTFRSGLPSLVKIDGTIRYWENKGDGWFADAPPPTQSPTNLDLALPGTHFVDQDGDGAVELEVRTPTGVEHYALRPDGQFEKNRKTAWNSALPFNPANPELRRLHFAPDGISQAIVTDQVCSCYFADRNLGWNKTEARTYGVDFPDVRFSDPRVFLADMTGDGLQDVVQVLGTLVRYWPGLGNGRWSKTPIDMGGTLNLPAQFEPKRLQFIDVDGDGASDLVYVDKTSVSVWINQHGARWGSETKILGSGASQIDEVRAADIFGRGTPGLLFSNVTLQPGTTVFSFLDFNSNWRTNAVLTWPGGSKAVGVLSAPMFPGERLQLLSGQGTDAELADVTGTGTSVTLDFGGASAPAGRYQVRLGVKREGSSKPYLLTRIDNQIGGETKVTYGVSTSERVRDAKQAKTRWTLPLPFPVHVVTRVVARDLISASTLTSEYRYHHGYWDGSEERQFRGFGFVEQWDSQLYASHLREGAHPLAPEEYLPTVVTKTWFHLGDIGNGFDGWTERDAAPEWWAADPSSVPRDIETLNLLTALPASVRRYALRAWRGREIRSEVYRRVGANEDARPHLVMEQVHALRRVVKDNQKKPTLTTSGSGAAVDSVFFPFTAVVRRTEWDGGVEPRTRIEVHESDRYGRNARTVDIAVPRLRDWRQSAAAGVAPYLATATKWDFAERDDATGFIVDAVARETKRAITNNGTKPALDLAAVTPLAEPLSQVLHFYDGPDFEGFAFGKVMVGLVKRTETLVLTKLAATLYLGAARELLAKPVPTATAELPALFLGGVPAAQKRIDLDLAGLGYGFSDGSGEFAAGYFAATERRKHDARGLVVEELTATGGTTVIEHEHQLLPRRVTDPLKLVSTATYDKRTLKIETALDANGATTLYTYTPLGMLESESLRGKAPGDGDPSGKPGVEYSYGLQAFSAGGPLFVHVKERVNHGGNETIEHREYSDALGRVVQVRAMAEDTLFGVNRVGDGVLAPWTQGETHVQFAGKVRPATAPVNVVVTGFELFDNKGNVVEKFEPAFSVGWPFESAAKAPVEAVSARLRYDAFNRRTHNVRPDGAMDHIVYGTVGNVKTPETHARNPWETWTYDANDNAGRTGSSADPAHHNTPSIALFDARGLEVERREWLTASKALSTRYKHDLNDNLIEVTDPLARKAHWYAHDLLKRPIRVGSLDAGDRIHLFAADGLEVLRQDAKGGLTLRSWDAAGKRLGLWARDAGPVGSAVTFRERYEYGGPASGSAPAYGLGRLKKQYDEAGLLEVLDYDFKGQVQQSRRRTVSVSQLLTVFVGNIGAGAYRVDWTPGLGQTFDQRALHLLDTRSFDVNQTFDRMGRILETQTPTQKTGGRAKLRFSYNAGGAVQSIELDGKPHVSHVAYNARGQQTAIVYGGGISTRICHDKHSFQVRRIRSERSATTATQAQLQIQLTQPSSPIQDLTYDYDAAGNVVACTDRSPKAGVGGSASLKRVFVYDPLYRLVSATGRRAAGPIPLPWDPSALPDDPTKTIGHTEVKSYDDASNLKQLGTRTLFQFPATNRLETAVVPIQSGGALTVKYQHDAAGNLTKEAMTRNFRWDHLERLSAFWIDSGAQHSQYAQYLYDSDGKRVAKLVRMAGGSYQWRVYIDGIFEAFDEGKGSGTTHTGSQTLVQLSLGDQRVSTTRDGDVLGDPLPAESYALSDHLKNVTSITNAVGVVLRREEFSAFGDTTFGSHDKKQYRYRGKERDRESGLVYFGARYYAPWVGRWATTDPTGPVDGPNTYAYVRNNPVTLNDRTGRFVESAWDAINVGMGIKSIASWDCNTSLRDKVLDVAALTADLAALALPFVPAGAGMLVNGIKTAQKAVSVVQKVDATATRLETAKEVVKDLKDGKLGSAGNVVLGAAVTVAAAVIIPKVKPKGRGKNNLKPYVNPENGTKADGPHTTFKLGENGKVSNHAEWDAQDNPVKRVDVTGQAHGPVKTPHTHKFGPTNVDPASGKSSPGNEISVSASTTEELPNR